MKKRSTPLTVAFFLVSAITTACSSPAPTAVESTPAASPAQRITSESVVKVEAQPVQISAGGSAEAVVRVTIKDGYHVNANPPTFAYLKATTLEIPAADGVSVAFVTYPKALEKQFAFSPDKALAVYEGVTELKPTLKADKAAKTGDRTLPAHLRIQACDDQVCYPPGTLELTIPVNIK